MMGGRFGGGAENGCRGEDDGSGRKLAIETLPAATPTPNARPEANAEAEPARARDFGEALVPSDGRRLLSLRGEEWLGGRESGIESECCDRRPMESTLIRRAKLVIFCCCACCCW
jgi:hypothetical protein